MNDMVPVKVAPSHVSHGGNSGSKTYFTRATVLWGVKAQVAQS